MGKITEYYDLINIYTIMSYLNQKYTHEYYGYSRSNNKNRQNSHLSKDNPTLTKRNKQWDSSLMPPKSTSSVKSESGRAHRNGSAVTNVRDRIEKACKTLSTSDMKKQNFLLQKELERLEKQILKKDQLILDLKTSNVPTKELKAELEQVYHALNYYEGRIKELQSQIIHFRQIILTAPAEGVTLDNLNILFGKLRTHNEQLHGKLQETEYQRWVAENKYHKIQSNYFEIKRELAQQRRKQASPLKHLSMQKNGSISRMNKLINELIKTQPLQSIESKQKDALIKHYSNLLEGYEMEFKESRERFEQMEENYEHQVAANEVLRSQIDAKQKQNEELFKKYAMSRKTIRYLESEKKIEGRVSDPYLSQRSFKLP